MGTEALYPEVKQSGHGINHSPPDSARVQERVVRLNLNSML